MQGQMRENNHQMAKKIFKTLKMKLCSGIKNR